MNLTTVNVARIFLDCLWNDDEVAGIKLDDLIAKSTVVEGVVRKIGFDPEKLAKHKDDIKSMLSGLPNEFMIGGGGGYSFLKACEDKNGNQWADLHQTMDELFMLGQAVKMVRPCLPRHLWDSLPGAMPYYVVNLDEFPTP